MINLFTPSFADQADTNAQNLSVKEIVSRLDPERTAVTMLHEGPVDPRIAKQKNIRLLHWHRHGNTIRTLGQLLTKVPDVYFFPREGPLDAAFLKTRRLLRLKTALVTHIVSGGLYSQSYGPARTRNIHEADAVFANNTYLAELLREKTGVEAGVIHNGIDRRNFFPRQSERDANQAVTVLYAGSMRPYKRVPLVVQQAACWPDVNFRIAGTGEEEQICKDLTAERKCANVQFLGHLSQADLGEEMRRADIFFFPSNIEGHPQVVGQAAACGVPVIALKIYRPDYVSDGSTGFLCENDDELHEKLDLLIRQRELRISMGRAAALHAKQFDWDVIARQWQQVFDVTAAKRQKH